MKKKTARKANKEMLKTSTFSIQYDPIVREYAVYVGDMIVGFAPNYSAAEELRLKAQQAARK